MDWEAVTALRLRGNDLEERGDFQAAREVWLTMTRRFPEHWPGFARLGILQRDEGRHPEAIRSFASATRWASRAPDLAFCTRLAAGSLRAGGRTEEAIAAYRTSLSLDLDVETGVYFAELLHWLGRLEEALEVLRTLEPRDAEHEREFRIVYRGVLRDLGDAESIRRFRESCRQGRPPPASAITSTPIPGSRGVQRTMRERARRLEDEDHLDAAIAVWTMLTERFPESWWEHAQLGGARKDRGQHLPAIVSFEEAARLATSAEYRALCVANVGCSLRALGRTREAVSAFERSLSIAFNEWAALNLGILLRMLGRLHDAAEVLEAASRTVSATNDELWGAYASALRDLGRHGEAEAARGKAAALQRAAPLDGGGAEPP